MSDKRLHLIMALVMFILPSIFCFYEAASHEHTRDCTISNGQNREGEISVWNSTPSKKDCVRHYVWIGGVLALLGVGTIINVMREKD
jgi:hypothetical protein